MNVKLLTIVLLAPIFVGCASVAGTTEQQVAIDATCSGKQVSGAACVVTNDKGSWPTTTPGSVNLTKSYEDISVVCTYGDIKGATVMTSKSNGSVWGNILLGGGIGYLVDRNTGAGFNYPTSIAVPLGDGCETAGRKATTGAESSMEERLKNLQNLFDKGLITSDEYDQRRAKMLEAL